MTGKYNGANFVVADTEGAWRLVADLQQPTAIAWYAYARGSPTIAVVPHDRDWARLFGHRSHDMVRGIAPLQAGPQHPTQKPSRLAETDRMRARRSW